jgi:hypothetical protein
MKKYPLKKATVGKLQSGSIVGRKIQSTITDTATGIDLINLR